MLFSHGENFAFQKAGYFARVPLTPIREMLILQKILLSNANISYLKMFEEHADYIFHVIVLELQSKCNLSNLGSAVYCASNVTPNVICQMLSTRKFNCHSWNFIPSCFFHQPISSLLSIVCDGELNKY